MATVNKCLGFASGTEPPITDPLITCTRAYMYTRAYIYTRACKTLVNAISLLCSARTAAAAAATAAAAAAAACCCCCFLPFYSGGPAEGRCAAESSTQGSPLFRNRRRSGTARATSARVCHCSRRMWTTTLRTLAWSTHQCSFRASPGQTCTRT